MDSADLGIWVDRKKREDVVRDLTFLRLADGRPPRSQAREACRRAALTESEPDRRASAEGAVIRLGNAVEGY